MSPTDTDHPSDQDKLRHNVRLWQTARDQRASNAVVVQCMPMVKRYARAYTLHHAQLYSEAVSAGLEGIAEALYKFDPEIEVDFIYFARMQVMYKIRKLMREHQKELAFSNPTDNVEEYGAELIDIDTYYAFKTVYQRYITKLRKRSVRLSGKALRVNERRIDILRLRYEKLLTYAEISAIVNIGRETVAQVCRAIEGQLNG